MADMFFQEDDFVVTLDPTQVVEVKTSDYSYFFATNGERFSVPKKYKTLCKTLLDLVKCNFEQPNQLEQAQLSYRIDGFLATRFVLSFPNIKTYNEAFQLVKANLTAKFGHEPWIDQSVRNLQFAINFPTYYSFYKENKALIISILGEPTKD